MMHARIPSADSFAPAMNPSAFLYSRVAIEPPVV